MLIKHAFVKLLNEVLLGNISAQGLPYICDCFTLAERIEFQNELIKDFVFEIADLKSMVISGQQVKS